MTAAITSDRPTADEIAQAVTLGATPPPGYEAAPEPAPSSGRPAGTVPSSPCARRLSDVVADVSDLKTRVGALEQTIAAKPLPTPRPLPLPVDPDTSVRSGGDNGQAELGRVGGDAGDVVVRPGRPTGGTVVVNPAPVIPALSKQQGPDPVAGIGYMRSTATLNRDGRLNVTTSTWSVQDLAGYTGGVFVVAYDGAGSILARSTIHQFGVDGKWVLWSQSSRTDNWSETFGVDAATKATRLGIVHIHAPHPRFFEDLGVIVNDIATVAALIAKLCIELPDVCATVGAALAA